MEFRLSWAGEDGVGVFNRRVKTIAMQWFQARQWVKDVEVQHLGATWRHICSLAKQGAEWEMEDCRAKEEHYRREGKVKEAMEAHEVAERILVNLNVHFRESRWLQDPFPEDVIPGMEALQAQQILTIGS